MKRKEIVTDATTWLKLEDIMLGDISLFHMDKDCVIHFCELSRVVRFGGTESTVMVARGCKMRRVLWVDGGYGSKTM